jgi:hypothetical protein
MHDMSIRYEADACLLAEAAHLLVIEKLWGRFVGDEMPEDENDSVGDEIPGDENESVGDEISGDEDTGIQQSERS